MRIVQLTPGAGKMYCGACLRDNALVAALRKLGHAAAMVPLYLPLTLDEEDQSAGTPNFYSGVNVYLDQQSALYRRAPEWLHRWMASPLVLHWAESAADKTRPDNLGELTLSMLRGEEGNQARELDELILWLRDLKPEIISLSDVLLAGMARRIKSELHVPVVCSLQGEDWFLDALASPHRERAWQIVAERAADVDCFIAPSKYFADLMSKRLNLPARSVHVIPNGINLRGYESRGLPPQQPVLGYLSRMCREKGLDTLVDAFIELKRRATIPNLRLRVGGSCGPTDQPLVNELRRRLDTAGVLADAEFCPNLSRAEKLDFLASLTVFSVPAVYGEAFGLYVIEALATGVPVIQPDHAAFPELIADTGGGLLCRPGNATALATTIENLLLEPNRIRSLGHAGHKAVLERYSIETMAAHVMRLYSAVARDFQLLNRPAAA